MVLQHDIRLCKRPVNKRSLPPKFQQRSSHYAYVATRGASLGMPRIRLQAFIIAHA